MPTCRVGPTNIFIPFSKGETEQSLPSRFAQQVGRYPQRLSVMADPLVWITTGRAPHSPRGYFC
jgi:hypothetical protein